MDKFAINMSKACPACSDDCAYLEVVESPELFYGNIRMPKFECHNSKVCAYVWNKILQEIEKENDKKLVKFFAPETT